MVERKSVDLSGYPDLVMVLLGLRLRSARGVLSMLRIGRGLATIQRDPPDGLLGQDNFLWGWNHVGIRQYWRDLKSLERFTRSAPHADWWKSFLHDNGGAGFWHEAYSRGGMEAVYLDMPPVGLARFAPELTPVGPFMSSRERIDRDREARQAYFPRAAGESFRESASLRQRGSGSCGALRGRTSRW